ncbi:helix-hairpin-helix domain-containing protein [Pedobacter sp.]|uniref:helix-hairpin-helix domain-containing protein n=1 Tax=Pedobacter sp. TaxID=1411316 RepID=UPI003D7FBE9B
MTKPACILWRTLFLFFLLSSFHLRLFAQQRELIKDIVERLAADLPDDFDLSELTEQLQYFADHPINLNKTSVEELKRLVILSPLQISNFFSHISSNGKLIDLMELQSIAAFDVQTIQNILPFVTLSIPSGYSNLGFKNMLHKGNSEVLMRFAQTVEPQKGYQELPGSRYLGSQEKLLLKYRFRYDQLFSFSAVLKKDAGEQLLAGDHKYGLDFNSFSLGLYKIGKISKLILGDYSLQFGQGLTLWSGFSFGKGPDVAGVAKNDIGLKTYTSSNEASFFRGVAATLAITQKLNFTPFLSYRKLDASQTENDSGIFTQVNISTSGLHRTKTELKNEKSLEQLVYGAALQYLSDNLSAGVVGYQSRYDDSFVTGNQAYNAYNFTGKELSNIGLHYNYTLFNIYLFGEGAKSLNGGMALLNGAMASISPKLSAVLVNRHYDINYHNFFSQAMGENSDATNEKGWYAGLNYAPGRKWTSSIYADIFRFPWLKYRINAPSDGFEVMTQLMYKPSKTFSALARYKTKENQQNTDVDVKEKYLDEVSKQNYRVEVNWRLNRKFSFQNRVELCRYHKGEAATESGYLVYQDIDYAPLSSRLSANIRLAYFNTESYNSRVYAYEDDVLYGFSFGMYNGKGARTFLNIKYKILRHMEVWTRYALFLYQDQETVGSGLDEIQGNRKSEVKLQLRYQF